MWSLLVTVQFFLAISAAANSKDSTRLLSTSVVYSVYSAFATPILPNISYDHFAQTPRKTPSSVVKNAYSPVHYLTMEAFLSLSAFVAGIGLPSRFLAMGIHVTIYYFIKYGSLHVGVLFRWCSICTTHLYKWLYICFVKVMTPCLP
jgi:hypothetical protein